MLPLPPHRSTPTPRPRHLLPATHTDLFGLLHRVDLLPESEQRHPSSLWLRWLLRQLFVVRLQRRVCSCSFRGRRRRYDRWDGRASRSTCGAAHLYGVVVSWVIRISRFTLNKSIIRQSRACMCLCCCRCCRGRVLDSLSDASSSARDERRRAMRCRRTPPKRSRHTSHTQGRTPPFNQAPKPSAPRAAPRSMPTTLAYTPSQATSVDSNADRSNAASQTPRGPRQVVGMGEGGRCLNRGVEIIIIIPITCMHTTAAALVQYTPPMQGRPRAPGPGAHDRLVDAPFDQGFWGRRAPAVVD